MKSPEDNIFNQESKNSQEIAVSTDDSSLREEISNEQQSDAIQILKSKIMDEIKITEIRKQIGTEKNQKQIQTFLSELPCKEGAIDFTQLNKVGKGGTHDVFVFPNNPAFVIKLNRGVLEKVLATGQHSIPPEMRQGAEQHVKNENSKYDKLYQYFGEANCLHERMSIQKVKTEVDDKPQEVETLISIQESSNVFANPDKKDFSTSYAEKNLTEETKEIYRKMNNALMGNGEFSETDFLQFNDKLKPIFELIDNDENFKNSMQEFLLRFKEYFSASENFIDLVGEENVLFYQKDGKWTFQLGSVLKAESKQNVVEALKILEKNPELLNTGHQKSNLMNGLALTRLLNAVGIKAGVGKIVDIQLTDKQLSNLDKVKF
jgi:hypothetical protein